MARSEKSENKNRVLGLDIGNGYGYVSLLENPKNDPIPLLPASLSTQGMPTTAYVKPPNGEQIDVFSDGRAAEQKYARTPQQLVYAAKTQKSSHRRGRGDFWTGQDTGADCRYREPYDA